MVPYGTIFHHFPIGCTLEGIPLLINQRRVKANYGVLASSMRQKADMNGRTFRIETWRFERYDTLEL